MPTQYLCDNPRCRRHLPEGKNLPGALQEQAYGQKHKIVEITMEHAHAGHYSDGWYTYKLMPFSLGDLGLDLDVKVQKPMFSHLLEERTVWIRQGGQELKIRYVPMPVHTCTVRMTVGDTTMEGRFCEDCAHAMCVAGATILGD